MNERSPYLSSTSMFCFLAGGAAGAALSLLLAPQSGKAARQMMAGKLTGGAESARRLRDRVVTQGAEAWGEAGHRVGQAASALAGNGEPKVTKRTDVPAL